MMLAKYKDVRLFAGMPFSYVTKPPG